VRLLGDLQAAFGATLTACELVSHVSLGLVLKHIPGAQAPLAESPWYLLVELSGGGDDVTLRAALEEFLGNALENESITDAVIAQSVDQAKRLWALRETSAKRRRSKASASSTTSRCRFRRSASSSNAPMPRCKPLSRHSHRRLRPPRRRQSALQPVEAGSRRERGVHRRAAGGQRDRA
jgi:hypothetical protein